MSMTLNPVNEAAFQKAVQSLETLNRAAVFHPTGTGKSCIAWKVVEAHPQTTFFWLVAGAQRLALRQSELTRYNGGTLPGNVRFCDCEKLAAATPEQWVRLGEQKPGCIVLDCYHELSAVCWAQSVQKLLRMCPQAKVLGLGVPNGAPVCAAAQELFADCIVSHMTVAEAMAAGTMPVPSAYAALLWPQEEELATLRARIKNLCMPKGDTSLRVQYEELSWSLRQVENLTVLLPRLLSDTSGHYLVLFESAAYQEKLGTELEQLLRTVDPAVRFYAADHACFADSAAVETFLSDTAPGPKVLLCVNAPGVQQPLEGLAGVILVRQSSLMSTFKQMLCRALVAAGSRSVPVFDLVAQFEGLGNGRTLQRDCTEAMTRAGSKTPGFRQERPMQQTYRLYGKLRREMEARWEVLCQAAADAAAKEGTLELPRSYTIHSGVPVGKWLELQRQVQAGQRPGRLTAEQAAKLEKLGIRWNHRLEAAWEKGFASAQKYRTEHGDLLVPVRYRDKNDFALGEWIVYNRQRYLGGNLTQNRIERLEAIGMVWSTSNDLWEQNYAAATQYYLEHGDLEVPIKYETPSGFGLGVWLGAQRAAHKAGELPQEQVERLDALGMDWTNRNDRKWMSLYDVAAAYYHEHGNLNVPSEYVTPDGVLLGKWVARQRYAYLNPDRSSARVTPERKALLDKLGMVWEKYDPWQERYDLALAYKTEHGDLEIPSVYKTADGVWLGSWVSRQRQVLNSGSSALSSERRKLLRILFKGERRPSDPAADHGTVREANWERNFRSAARYARKYKHLLVPASYVDSDGVRLGVWISNLRAARKNRPDSYQVTPAHIKKLNSIGMVWDARDAKWGTAYQQAKAYYKAHGNLHAAANYKSDETGFCLGDWLRRMREWDTTHDPKLTPERRAMLDKIGMEWSE
ncbi:MULTISPECIES: Helicase associated domain protein [Faecalibacterium]|uniref:Helicase associated domain-containing protein n=1 Tax=Faecalibacterium hominis (ex Afrizal et al. 2022) TaxID=2881265 RepID=A0ABS8FDV0_9FIRM|nr:helicase associated domain-containing protein [Faecalibacterium hominis (ex Afrizal et al. 2022)]MCC2212720.1 helicase associated domain-containing protein [Faecalibacterium hominis (ex Afrizal et al. 2022)]